MMMKEIRERYRKHQEERFTLSKENSTRQIQDRYRRRYTMYDDTDMKILIEEINHINSEYVWHTLFVEWLIECGIISEDVPKIFDDAIKYENHYIKEIASIVGQRDAEKVYEKIKDKLR